LRWLLPGALRSSFDTMISVLKLKSRHLQTMHKHVSTQAPLEAFGLLSGKNGQLEQTWKARGYWIEKGTATEVDLQVITE